MKVILCDEGPVSEVNVEVPPRTEVAAVAADEAGILVGWDITIAIFLATYILLFIIIIALFPPSSWLPLHHQPSPKRLSGLRPTGRLQLYTRLGKQLLEVFTIHMCL